MARSDELFLARAVAQTARPLTGGREDFAPILDAASDAQVVLIGEASHGTHEFYRLRAQLTQRLILEKGFAAVAVEGDWPDASRVSRYVRGLATSTDADAEEALRGFHRFPSWMWRNADVLDFVGWMRAHNETLGDAAERVDFVGLDLYSLHSSASEVISYLEKVDPAAAARARERYGCFDHFGEEPQEYGHAAALGLSASCESQVAAQLVEMLGRGPQEALFDAQQNARVVKNAEQYYRSMFGSRVSSWNLRDTHMADTLHHLLEHLERRNGRARVVVWAHNSHVGDARATEMGEDGELNIGQLARERYPGKTVIVGFSTHSGTVTAASDWDGPAERKRVRPGLEGSYESLFHATGIPDFLLSLRELGEAAGGLREPRLQRAIGVIYRPQTERMSHYFRARLPDQFDFLLHLDQTRALEPLERSAGWERGEAPETYPFGI